MWDFISRYITEAIVVLIIAAATLYYAHRRTRIADQDLALKKAQEAERQTAAAAKAKEDARLAARRIDTTPHLRDIITGREREVADLHAAMQTGMAAALIALHGTGGIGKTTLALAYVRQHGRDYAGIGWLGAETEDQVLADLRKLGEAMGMTFPPEQKPDSIAHQVLAAIRDSGDKWLLIFDNAENAAAVAPYRLQAPNVRIIVTSQQADWPVDYTPLPVDVLDFATEDGPAVTLLMRESRREADRAGARELAKALGGLPLALVLAGAWLRGSDEAFADYAGRWHRVLDEAPKDGTYRDTIIAAVAMSVGACGRGQPNRPSLGPDCKALLDLFAWLAPDLIEAKLAADVARSERAERIMEPVPETLRELATDPDRLSAAMRELGDRSLLTGGDGGFFSLHRMTAAAIRALQAGEGRAEAAQGAAAAVISARYPYDVGLAANWPECRRLTPHVLALAARRPLPQVAAMRWLVHQAGGFLSLQAQTGAALDLARAGLELSQALHGPDHRSTGTAWNQLGRCLLADGNLKEAERAFGEAIRIARGDPDQRDALAIYLSNLGTALTDLGRLPEARDNFEDARRIGVELHGERSRQVGTRLNNLAGVNWDLEDRPTAIDQARQALDIERAQPEPDAALLGYCLNNLGSYLLRTGALDEAEGLLEEALKLRSGAYQNPHHPDVVRTAAWLAACHLMRAIRGEDPVARRAGAQGLAAAHGLGMEKLEAAARQILAEIDAAGPPPATD